MEVYSQVGNIEDVADVDVAQVYLYRVFRHFRDDAVYVQMSLFVAEPEVIDKDFPRIYDDLRRMYLPEGVVEYGISRMNLDDGFQWRFGGCMGKVALQGVGHLFPDKPGEGGQTSAVRGVANVSPVQDSPYAIVLGLCFQGDVHSSFGLPIGETQGGSDLPLWIFA